MIDHFRRTVALSVFFLLGFVPAAYAASAATPDDGSLLDLARPILDAVLNGHGWIAAASALILLTATVRRVFPSNKFLASPFGAIVLVFAGSYAGAVLTALAAAGTTTLTLALAYGALKVAVTAAGGFAALRPLLVDVVEPFVVKRFPWAVPLFDLLTWVFDKPSDKVIEVATAAGVQAVAAAPSGGADAVVGKATEIQ